MNKSTIKYYFLSAILAFSFAGCKDNIQSSIPDFPVYLELNLTSTYPNFKNNSNQYIIYEKRINEIDRIGYGGILIYAGMNFDDYGNIIYYAYDMACPYEAKQSVRVYPNEKGQAVCKTCGSIFDIGYGNGNPLSGPAREYLKRYRATLSGDILYITR